MSPTDLHDGFDKFHNKIELELVECLLNTPLE